MKNFKSLLIVLAITGCGNDANEASLKGTPDQDPIINQYRILFQTSQKPTMQDLKLGSVWECQFRAAYKNDYRQGQATYVFDSYANRVVNHGSAPIKDFILGWIGLGGAMSGYSMTMRLDQNGNLIGEWSVANGLFPSWYSVPALVDPNRRAYGYEYCVAKNSGASAGVPSAGDMTFPGESAPGLGGLGFPLGN